MRGLLLVVLVSGCGAGGAALGLTSPDATELADLAVDDARAAEDLARAADLAPSDLLQCLPLGEACVPGTAGTCCGSDAVLGCHYVGGTQTGHLACCLYRGQACRADGDCCSEGLYAASCYDKTCRSGFGGSCSSDSDCAPPNSCAFDGVAMTCCGRDKNTGKVICRPR